MSRMPPMPEPPSTKVTLREVAATLGVSAKTVSNAFSRLDQLSERLRVGLRVSDDLSITGFDDAQPAAELVIRGSTGPPPPNRRT